MLLFILLFTALVNANIVSIFPAQYSQYFGMSSEKTEVLLSETILEEKNHGTYGISLWIKATDINNPWGYIFSTRYSREYLSRKKLLSLPALNYNKPSKIPNSEGLVLCLATSCEDHPEFQLSLSIAPKNNWIFVALSASHENKSILFYCKNLLAEAYISEIFDLETTLYFNSVLSFGNEWSFAGRIGDFKIYNNIYYGASDWNLQYSTSVGVSCTSLFPSIDYGHCDQWCESRTESFIPLIQPSLYSYKPYLVIDNEFYLKSTLGIVVPDTAWSDYSITGWAQFEQCQDNIGTIFNLHPNSHVDSLSIKLISSASSGSCDKLEATISTTDGVNAADDSAYIIGSNYIGGWFFFALTVNSGSQKLTLYSQNGINPPSTSFPLLHSSVIYTYTAMPFSLHDAISIGGKVNNPYKGNYADFRFFYGKSIDSVLNQYNNNIYSAATYLDPHCALWESIWYCQTCESGYFVKKGICQKCHPSCASCSSDDSETNCLSCATGYYAQPGHPSMCMDYCPLGYTWDSSFNECTGTNGVIANINFDNNLSGNIFSSNVYIELGVEHDNYYPEFDMLDPIPANKRGIYIFRGLILFSPQSSVQAERLFSSDFTLETWIMVETNGKIYSATIDNNYYPFDNKAKYFSNFIIETDSNGLMLEIEKNDWNNTIEHSPEWSNSGKSREWAFYSVSFKFDDISQSTEILFVKNINSGIVTIPNYHKEFPGMIHAINSPSSFVGFMYSFGIYNYGRTYSEIQLSLGTCSSCTACPEALNSCLPTCDKTEYVDDNGNCQKCPASCSWICSRADTCNLCYDDLCYKCSKYETGACSQCVEDAVFSNGQCKCKNGYMKQGSQCVDICTNGFYFDANTGSCLSCTSNCLKCIDSEICSICKNDYALRDGKCECAGGYILGSLNKCLKCDTSCFTCSIKSSNCTSCISDLPILHSNKCYSCDSFEGYSYLYSFSALNLTSDLLYQLSSNCIEICGDGRNMGQVQCDDGNINNGDGCSENCTVETGWTCFGGNVNSSDICKDETSPSPILAYLSESDSGYLLALSFSEKVNIASNLSENIEIQIDGVKTFSWTISSEKSIFIIKLYIYKNVSSMTSVTLTFYDPSAIVDMSGNQMREKLVKTYLLSPFTYRVEEVMETSVTTTIIVAAAGAVGSSMLLGTFNLQALWSIIEIMQIQNYLIFLTVSYPNNLISYLRSLSIANGNFLPNPFQKYIVQSDPFPDPPQKFIDENLNTDFLMNAGQFVCVWAISLAGLPICLILFKLRPRISIIRWLKSSYLFSILLRIGIESFLAITLSIFLQLRECSQPNQDIGYLSLILCFSTILYLVITFALIIKQVTLKSKEILEGNLHKRQFGVLYEEFKKSSKLAASFLLFQHLRRVLFVASFVFLYDYTSVQVSLSVILSLTYTILLILLRPYEKKYLGNCLHIICEILHLASNCLILKLLDDQISDDFRTNLGWSIISLLGTSLLLHVICLFVIQITNLIIGVKRIKESFMKQFANKFVVKRRINLETKKFNKIKGVEKRKLTEEEKFYQGTTSENRIARFSSIYPIVESLE